MAAAGYNTFHLQAGDVEIDLSNGSVDFVIAFSTQNLEPYEPDARERKVTIVENDSMSPLFLATVEAVEEAVYNSLLKATTMTGFDGHTVEAIPVDSLREFFRTQLTAEQHPH